MLLDLHGHLGQPVYLLVNHRPLHLLLWVGLDGPAAGALPVDHLDELRAHGAGDDGVLALRERGLEDIGLIRSHRAADDRLAEAVGAGDEDDVTV